MLRTFSKAFDTKTISVTIDDGPNPETTPLLLEVLARYQAKANFFVCGKKVADNPALAKLIVDSGHRLYSHGFSHRNFIRLTEDEIIGELDNTERLLSEFRPTPSPYLIRLPYGSGFNVPRVNEAVARWRKDAAFIQWSLSPAEWQFVGNCHTPFDVSELCERAIEELSREDWSGGIILLHDWPVTHSWPTDAKNGNPAISVIRPFFCAALLEKLLIAAQVKKLTYALL